MDSESKSVTIKGYLEIRIQIKNKKYLLIFKSTITSWFLLVSF